MHIEFPLVPNPAVVNCVSPRLLSSVLRWMNSIIFVLFRFNQDWVHFLLKVQRWLHLNVALLFSVSTFWNCCHFSCLIYCSCVGFFYIFGNWFYELIYILILTRKSEACFALLHFQGPNSVMIVLVMLLNIGLAILFVHFLTWLELGKVRRALISI